ncbi:MAG TPA: hypothetical protein VFT59_03395 [Candidatus Saccharimonadales bacterium]|nr:hypothetical protein [Candidatus Saccharimonadales bacterium]
MSKGIYTTFSSDSEEASFINEVLPLVMKALGVPNTTHPIYSHSLAGIIRDIYGQAESSPEEHLYGIFTDMSGDEQELVRLLSATPMNVGIQLIAVNAAGIGKVAKLQHLRSPYLAFMIMAKDEETKQIADQIIIDHSHGGNGRN